MISGSQNLIKEMLKPNNINRNNVSEDSIYEVVRSCVTITQRFFEWFRHY